MHRCVFCIKDEESTAAGAFYRASGPIPGHMRHTTVVTQTVFQNPVAASPQQTAAEIDEQGKQAQKTTPTPTSSTSSDAADNVPSEYGVAHWASVKLYGLGSAWWVCQRRAVGSTAASAQAISPCLVAIVFPGLKDRVLSKCSDAHIYLDQGTCSPFQRWQSAFVSSGI